ncbi:hypothetical protein [Rubrivivax albus]|uniref:hypothetical protein n=1 Tax=Rubrivivax albus TaxID=2499835 RepID=UPI0013052D20|nr:hypothetical protein [Rubrivivax albus]
MNRQDIQLLAAARAGDADAHVRAGTAYLLGSGSFPRHLRSGIEHLTHPSVAGRTDALASLCAHLSVVELLESGLLPLLQKAAAQGIDIATEKLALWWLTQPAQRRGGLQMLRVLAARTGSGMLAGPQGVGDEAERARAIFWSMSRAGRFDGAATLRLAWRAALGESGTAGVDADRVECALCWCLALLSSADAKTQDGLASEVVASLEWLEDLGVHLHGLPVAIAERLLTAAAERADARACFRLGRALAGLPCGAMSPESLSRERNLRRGTALLLRAADAGRVQAWMLLHALAADHRCSVANPQMARFFLEKAAQGGIAEAQRRLGVLLLREARSLEDSETAIAWLHLAREQGDALAARVLASLVLPVPGADADAVLALRALRAVDPALAARLSLARHFGLTRTEALVVDPAGGERPWGLVVGPIAHLRQPRLAAPRAVPAADAHALRCLRESAELFMREPRERLDGEGAVRTRTRSLRTLLDRHGIAESLFFAPATGQVLDSLRRGSRWAVRAGTLVQAALTPGSESAICA